LGIFPRSKKKSEEDQSHCDNPTEHIPASHPSPAAEHVVEKQVASPSASSAHPPASKTTTRAPEDPACENEEDVGGLRRRLERANDRLAKAAEKLKNTIPEKMHGNATFEFKASADINALADSIGSVLVSMMDVEKVEKSRQAHVQDMVKEWAKKTLPFLGRGLNIAKVPSHPRITV